MIIWQDLSMEQQQACLNRPVMSNKQALTDNVAELIADVKRNGDQALLALTKKFDGLELNSVALPIELQEQTIATLSDERKQAIELAYNNIKKFHHAQYPKDIEIETSPGVNCQLLNRPIESVGLYIPGGSAPLPSTVLMLGVPAQIAGNQRVVLCTPPDTSDQNKGSVTAEILYAAKLCGIKEVNRVGGAQAVAAMAYGTETIGKVDKIFGPGNSYVTEAKQQVNNDPYGAVIDMPAGPSEVLVIADKNADAEFIAADLLSQAEHGPDSQVILLCDDKSVIEQTSLELEKQLALLPRAEIAKKALANSSLILTENLEQSIEVSNKYAPEHLIVQIDNSESVLAKLQNAASIFLGAYTPESAGDYASGTNHVLPTYGYSKTLGSLNLADFMRKFTVQTVSKKGMAAIGPAIMCLAEAEGLDAHRNAVAVRMAKLSKD